MVADFGTKSQEQSLNCVTHAEEAFMHGIIYLVGLIVVILAVLSFFGLR